MKAYKVTGEFKMKPDVQKFSKEVAAKDQKDAIEQVISDLGSKHRAKRNEIKVDAVTEIKGDDINSSVVKYRMQP